MTSRMYGRWEKPRSAGFFGLTWGVSMLGLGLVIAVMVSFMVTRSVQVSGALLLVSALVFTPLAVTVDGRTGWELVLLRVQFAVARARGEHVLQQGRFSRIPGIAKLPGLLADSRLSEYETPGGRRFALIHIPRTDHYTVVMRVIPRGKELVDQAQIDAWVEEYGRFLATQSRGGEVVAVTAVLDNVVEPRLKQTREVTRLVRPDAPAFARQVMAEAGADVGGVAVRIEARIAITYRAIGKTRLRRDTGEQAREIGRRQQGVLSQLARAGLPATPLQAWEVMGLVRSRYDLAAQRDIEAAGPDLLATQSWDSVGPLAHRDRWDHYVHDGGRSITWEMNLAPQGAVPETVLEELLRPRADVPRKRVAIVYRLHSAAEATSLVDSDYKDALAAEQTQRGVATAGARIRVGNTEATRIEQARGAGLTRFGLLVTVTDHLDADIPGIEASVQGMSAASRLGVRRCYGTQAAAFAASLGIGLILPEHTSISKRVSA
ncbi:SCO6880 family protein [Nocardia cyriacigeorgica]|uniref:SCO6880 family protein n=1 Tax=Nocardia cyriacigeorgica TaxID=135487 RepID=UPI002453EC08|nr:SCO6880 family protein [Nocardia cyriacigeorgica]